MTGWRVDIKSETQVAEEAAYADIEWAEGEWILDEATGEQVWRPAEGGPAVSAGQWTEAAVADEGPEPVEAVVEAEAAGNSEPEADDVSDGEGEAVADDEASDDSAPGDGPASDEAETPAGDSDTESEPQA
jgi:hypothetical protein